MDGRRRDGGGWMKAADQIDEYHRQQSVADQAICAILRSEIDTALPDATSKIWHAHPVWFLDGNPIVGYSRLKAGMRLMFWSGQSFGEEGLKGKSKFKDAAVRYSDAAEINIENLRRWLGKARDIQWDYQNIVKRKGLLERLK
ncbi:MAG: DUF1801 domain-containing protein [Sphingopyxis sp.]